MPPPPDDKGRPAFAVTVNGTALPVDAALDVSSIRVDADATLPSMFTLELAGGTGEEPTAWIDGDLFKMGGTVEIKLGYNDTLDTVISAEITGIEPVFTHGTQPHLIVRGYDRRHRLQRGRKTRSFVQQKDSDIASTIASEAGLTADATDSEVTHEYILQANQTDMEFLLERARLIRYELVVEDKTLYFRPVQNDQGELLTMSPEDDLLEFYPRLSTMGQATEFKARGWNPKEKKEFEGKAAAGDEVSTMGGQNTGAALADSAFGAASVLIGSPVVTQAEADQLARATFNRAILGLISGEGMCSGRTDLKPGSVIKLDGIGERFSGQYYVRSTSHHYTPRYAYQTQFVVWRNAS
jgi:Bacteriophage probable baseplate hub protein